MILACQPKAASFDTSSSLRGALSGLLRSAGARFNAVAGHAVMAMITSAGHPSWPLDVDTKHLQSAGLPAASLVRMKLFTLDLRLVTRKAGALHFEDASRVRDALGELLGQRLTVKE